MPHKPEILAPAGDMSCALAALAAGTDAMYLGLKHFSARMQAENFSSAELASLVDLAHAEGRKIYLAVNTFVKPGEEASLARLLRRVRQGPEPDALVVQDLALADLARQAGFEGELHYSTLANLTHQACMQAAAKLGARRIILPRELSIDEIRLMDEARPEGMGMEYFVHGALCYCVSGRCWWSSYLGGKSGLRGRCVQPCRRVYKQGGKEGRFFSCRDLSLDVLVKTLMDIPGVVSWKIEGRKKGPHYVYHVITAYRMLRDNVGDPAAKKEALALLEMALGRPGTKARFLPQHSVNPTAFGDVEEGKKNDFQTSSGLLAGKIVHEQAQIEARPGKGKNAAQARKREPVCILKPRMELLPQDYLRIGYEDEPWHQTLPLRARLPKGGSLTLKIPLHKTPRQGTPVFLIDRKEKELVAIIREWKARLDARKPKIREDKKLMDFTPAPPRAARGQGGKKAQRLEISLRSSLPRGKSGKENIRPGSVQGLWLSPKALTEVSRTLFDRVSWWLPPVIWPDEEENWKRNIRQALRNGARHFVCNSPWQSTLFEGDKGLSLTAGPFCNITNVYAVGVLAGMGFSQAVISPELGEEDILALPTQSPLPLGVVMGGYWPVGLTRYQVDPLKTSDPFQSPKGESFWARKYGQNTWLYPAWPLDLSAKRAELERAGYSIFVHIEEHPPKSLGAPGRSSLFNWKVDVL